MTERKLEELTEDKINSYIKSIANKSRELINSGTNAPNALATSNDFLNSIALSNYAIYLQNQILIKQNQEIIDYLKDK